MRWSAAFFCCVAATAAHAVVPTDLQSPFLKTAIYQKKIGGYGVGPVEQKEVTQGIKKDGLFEFQKEDGTLFLVSESEILGVLPVFPSLQFPCEKEDVEAALRFLEKAKCILPQQIEVSEPVLEKWKSLALVLEEIDKEWRVSPDSLDQGVRNLFLVWALGMPMVLLLISVMGLFIWRKRKGFALILILIGLGGGILFWASWQRPTQTQTSQDLIHEEDYRRIFWALSCGKKAGLAGASTEFRVPIDSWLNFLFRRIRFPDTSYHGIQPALTKPLFQNTKDGVLVHQPVQVGPFLFPLAIEISLKGKISPESWVVKKIRMGRVPGPGQLAEPWVKRIFESYRFLWNEIDSGEAVEWNTSSPGEVKIQVVPRAT